MYMSVDFLYLLISNIITALPDSIDRGVLWGIMGEYGIPSKLITMVKAMYDQSKCAVVDGSGNYDWFEVRTGVKQGCCMSGFRIVGFPGHDTSFFMQCEA